MLRQDGHQSQPAAPVRARHERAELWRAQQPRGLRVRLQLRHRARRRGAPVHQPRHRRVPLTTHQSLQVHGRRAGILLRDDSRRRGQHVPVLLRHGPPLRPSPLRLLGGGGRPRRARRLVPRHDAQPAAVRRQQREMYALARNEPLCTRTLRTRVQPCTQHVFLAAQARTGSCGASTHRATTRASRTRTCPTAAGACRSAWRA